MRGCIGQDYRFISIYPTCDTIEAWNQYRLLNQLLKYPARSVQPLLIERHFSAQPVEKT